MVNPSGLSNAINKIVEQGAKEAVSKPQDVAQEDVQKFKDAVQPQEQAGLRTSGVDRAESGEVSAASAERSTSAGDVILRGMDKMRADEKAATEALEKLTSGGEVKPEELLSLKRQVDKMAFEEQVAVQGTSKADKDLNQLLKGQ